MFSKTKTKAIAMSVDRAGNGLLPVDELPPNATKLTLDQLREVSYFHFIFKTNIQINQFKPNSTTNHNTTV